MTSLESKETRDSVYPPSEDSFALIDAVAELKGVDEAVEIGCGSGLATLAIAKKSRRLIATDIDFRSAVNTYRVVRSNELSHKVDVLCCSMMDALRPSKTFDLIASNPPYLPVSPDDVDHDEVSYAGGPDGSSVATEMAIGAVSHSRSKSTVLFVVSSLTDISPLVELLKRNGFVSWIKQVRSLFFEKIWIVQASRKEQISQQSLKQ